MNRAAVIKQLKAPYVMLSKLLALLESSDSDRFVAPISILPSSPSVIQAPGVRLRDGLRNGESDASRKATDKRCLPSALGLRDTCEVALHKSE
jgi:hypothetical protein